MRFFENVLEAGKGIKCAKHENKKSEILEKIYDNVFISSVKI